MRCIRGTRSHAGWSLIEMLVSGLVLSFLLVATGTLYTAWQRQSLMCRNYSQAQTDLRNALRLILRAVRHGTTVVASINSGTSTLFGQTSSASQILVNVPQSGGSYVNMLFYVGADGNLYYQREGDATGTSIISNVKNLTIHYYRTAVSSITASGGTTTTTLVDTEPSAATEVEITLTVRSGSTADNTKEAAVVTATTYVALRGTSWARNTTPR